jgi:N-acyl-L-homoserine lactone synthetase
MPSADSDSKIQYRFKTAESPEELQEAFKLRYQVYCLEKRWLRKESYPDKVEKDSMDPFSKHFIAMNASGTVIGTVRLILDSTRGFPISEHPSPPITRFEAPEEAAEISRLIVAREHRNLKVSIGLYRLLYAFSQQENLRKWYLTIEPIFLRWFKSKGVRFAVIGRSSFFFGDKTIPIKCNLHETFGNMQERSPELHYWFNQDPSVIYEDEKIV